jgi:chromosome segregation ATPase
MAPLQQLKERVDALHQQLSATGELEAADRESLESLLADVARVLERDDEAHEKVEEDESLVDQLREAAENFEEQHPSITHAVGSVADALSRLGI